MNFSFDDDVVWNISMVFYISNDMLRLWYSDVVMTSVLDDAAKNVLMILYTALNLDDD